MFKEFLINNFNNKFAGKKLLFCHRIYEDIAFMPDSVLKCCHCTRMPYFPPELFQNNIKTFSFYSFIKNLERIMQSNQTENAVCNGCKFLKEQIVPELQSKEIIKFITINHFTKCNSNCVYCAIKNKTQDPKYMLLPIIKSLFNEEMINKECVINWGGGEPVICTEFEQLTEFFREKNIHQAINSSGVEFSQTILYGLKDCSMSIQISPDSGTYETYQKIKRQNNFDKVWENIKKYAQYPEMLFIKYIFFSLSANETDVREFINKCIDSNIKHIVIDCESNTANNPESVFGSVTEETVNLAVLMKKLAIENNISYEISYQWSEEYKKRIENG